MRRDPKHLLAPVLAMTLAGALTPSAQAAPPPAEQEAGPLSLRAAPPPSELERARVARWSERWRDEAAALEGSFAAATRAMVAGDDHRLRRRCVPLAGALLELERPQVLPVPDRAADLHVRRALRHLARAAVTCLTKRPYAARRSLEQAAEAFDQARRVLRRYRHTDRAPESAPSEP